MPVRTRRTKRDRKQTELFEAIPGNLWTRNKGPGKKTRTSARPAATSSNNRQQQRRADAIPKTQEGGNRKRAASRTTSRTPKARRGSVKRGAGSSSRKKQKQEQERQKQEQEKDSNDGTDSKDDGSSVVSEACSEHSFKSFKSNTKAKRTSPQASEISRISMSPPSPQRLSASAVAPPTGVSGRRRHHPGSISQFIGEDIICDPGLAFLESIYDSDRDETYEQWQGKYEHVPGITRVQTTSSRGPRKYNRRGSSSSVGSSGPAATGKRGGGVDVRYKSASNYKGVSINLGTHQSSAAAVAMQDLVNLSLLGSEHSKTMQILSHDEAWAALNTAKLPGVHPYKQVDQFQSLFTEQFKPVFEEKLDDALTSIGGQDDVLADTLCNLDAGAQRQAEAVDASQDAKLAKARERKEKELLRRARKAAKMARKYARTPRRTVKVNTPRFRGKHGVYGIDDKGRYFWFRARDHSKVRQQMQAAHAAEAENAREVSNPYRRTDVAKSTLQRLDDDNIVEQNLTPLPENAPANDHPQTTPSDSTPLSSDDSSDNESSSSSSSKSYASSISSVASAEFRKGRVRILSFDGTSDVEGDNNPSSSRRVGRTGHRQEVQGGAPSASSQVKEARAPGIPDAITITSACHHGPDLDGQESTLFHETENRDAGSPPCISESFEPLRLLIGGVTKQPGAPGREKERRGSCDPSRENLQAVIRILNEFSVTPLVSYSRSGVELADSEITGKTLTGIKFKRKSGQGAGLDLCLLSNQREDEFIIDVHLGQNGKVPELKLRGSVPVCAS
mmetsp:Transcript_6509/g.14302  ORF Transcript_6509/g.14302 Transcript_6509/m.14302 type:complete len:789 (-) Transcript_6509:225-2591(-)